MKKLILVLYIMVQWCRGNAQDTALRVMAPGYFISTDLVFDIESIPVIGYEKLFIKNNRLKSLQLDIGYQVHNNNQFGGLATSHGDRVSIGVYQGPAAKFGYSLYSHRHRHKWSNYYSPALGLKYLWYNDILVNVGKRMTPATRVQSEHCLDEVPQFSIGAKRTNKNFCADFYVGLQFPIKMRYKVISSETNPQGIPNPNVPYNSNVTTFMPAPLIGIRLGYVSKKQRRRE